MATQKEALDTIEETLDVYARFIYTKLEIPQTTYSSWKTGRNKEGRVKLYEKFKEVFGIDLYQSMQKDEIVISDATKLSADHYLILVTNGPVKIKTAGKQDGV